MEIIQVQINSSKAYRFLEDLEDLNLIKVLKADTTKTQKLSDKYRGVFSLEDAKSFDDHTQTMRKE